MNCTRSSILVAVSLIAAAIPGFVHAQVLPCDQAAMTSILSTYESGLKSEMKCPVAQLSKDTPSCTLAALPPGYQEREDALVATIAASCPTPGGNQTCALTAAYQYADVLLASINVVPGSVSDKTLRKCRKTLAQGSTKLARTAAILLEGCNAEALAGTTGYGPVGFACTDPSGRTQTAITDAENKFRRAIATRCGGDDRTIGGADDLDPQGDLGFPDTCYGSPGCVGAMPALADLADCTACTALESVGEAVAGAVALPIDDVANCRLGFARAYSVLADRNITFRSDCVTDRLGDPDAPACPSDEQNTRIADAESDALTRTLVRCSELDPQDDLAFPASCPDIGTCAGTDVSDFAGANECLRCVTAARTQQIVDTLAPVQSYEADFNVASCREDLLGAFGDFLGRKIDRLERCTRATTCEQTTATCPDARTTWRIDDERMELAQGVSAITSCAPGSGALDPQDLGFEATCPEMYSCGGTDTETLAGLVTCLTCIVDAAADELHALHVPAP